MFCDNTSFQTERMAQNCANYCQGNDNRFPTYNDIRTQQSQSSPSHYDGGFTNRNQQLKIKQNLDQINQMQALQMMHQNTKRENQQLKAMARNKKIAAILSTIIAFSQRIQTIKQKLAGYPGQSFSPVQFFNVLDLSQKGYVDLYDVKRFVNNERISQKDVFSLFKKVNGDHAKDSTKLSYFGYLKLIKPYFNESLARDLLLRDSGKAKKHKKAQKQKVDLNMLEPTQQSILLLFQQLLLLHCISTSEHQKAKQNLMNEYMLNVSEIKEIIGLNHLENIHTKIPAQSNNPSKNHKTLLKIYFEFIENNSQFEISFKEMKFLLSFLNAHEFLLNNEKYLTLLFIPMNCKNQLLKHFEKLNTPSQQIKGAQNYMNTYLTKQNLINKGNIQPIREYFQTGIPQQTTLAQNHMGVTLNSGKVNFLEFVHPKSLQRMTANNQPYPNDNVFPSEQYMDNPLDIIRREFQENQFLNQHPQMMEINPSNKHLSKNQSGKYLNPHPSQRQYSNPSSIPQENIKINPPRQTILQHQYGSNSALHKQFYNQPQEQNVSVNVSKISHTPFLEKFMKNNQNDINSSRIPMKNQRNVQFMNQDYSKISELSESAFEVVDYGYDPKNSKPKILKSNKKGQQLDESQKYKKETLDSRYNLIVSQYKNSQIHPEISKKNQNSKGNFIDNVGLSQSNMVNQSNFMSKFYSNGGGGILNEFLKK